MMVRVPVVLNVSLQLPFPVLALTVPEHTSPVLADKVTLPVAIKNIRDIIGCALNDVPPRRRIIKRKKINRTIMVMDYTEALNELDAEARRLGERL